MIFERMKVTEVGGACLVLGGDPDGGEAGERRLRPGARRSSVLEGKPRAQLNRWCFTQ